MKTQRFLLCLVSLWATVLYYGTSVVGADPAKTTENVISLNGQWLLATDPENVGKQQEWWKEPRAEAKPTAVPWIIQDAFPAYHGVAWYWRDLTGPTDLPAGHRCILRFWAVDYFAEVWLNGTRIGQHEGGEEPFEWDVTDVLRPGKENRLAVRVINPIDQPIDGIVLGETAHRNKVVHYGAGSSYNYGGITDSVELWVVPRLRVSDLYVRPDWKTGDILAQVTIDNTTTESLAAELTLSAGPAASGPTLEAESQTLQAPPGKSVYEVLLHIDNPHLWDLEDPYLYRVTARLAEPKAAFGSEQSTRCGFRDFRFADGAFRLNGKRIYLRCSHTGNHCPIGMVLPLGDDLLRRDLINCKVMGFNAIRFIAGVATRRQLDFCDELGLMVYEESLAGWCMGHSPEFGRRYDESVLGMVRRDRNHPSVTIWGLLNETPDGPVFQHVVAFLPKLRELDDSRLVLLNSGCWYRHGGGEKPSVDAWRDVTCDPTVTHNPHDRVIRGLGITWRPGQLASHPGVGGQYCVVRWTAPADGKIDVEVVFAGIAERATTDVHLFHNDQSLLDAGINVRNGGNEAEFKGSIDVKKGDTLDTAVGFGNGNYGADTTAVAMIVKTADGKTYDAAADFSLEGNPNGPWSYGQLAPGEKPDPATFAIYRDKAAADEPPPADVGCLSNPGSGVWENIMDDTHPYQHVPHTADTIRTLRTTGQGLPLFLSEYGIGSGVDLIRVVRHFEHLGKGEAEDALFYRNLRDQFLNDFNRWHMEDTFGPPEEFFAQSVAKMGKQRLLGINAIRANPNVIGHSVTGTVDQGMTGEGLTTTFRELKPGTIDAMFEAWAPLRLCMFAEPMSIYRGGSVKLEAVLADEDTLPPGTYPVRVMVLGPDAKPVFDRTIQVEVPERGEGPELPFARSIFSEEIPVDGPSGRYRFWAAFQERAAAAGGQTEFYISDPADMPPVEHEVAFWGDDPLLAQWLTEHGIRVVPFDPNAVSRQVILVSGPAPAENRAEAFTALAERIARGDAVVFLTPGTLAGDQSPIQWIPLAQKGGFQGINRWLYLSDDWAKRHPIFDGLPAGGLLDSDAHYRHIVPDVVFMGQPSPDEAVAGACNVAQGYQSGLTVAVYRLGAGRWVINALRIRETLGSDPTAERLLRNMLRYAAAGTDQPLAPLPEDFQEQVKAWGY